MGREPYRPKVPIRQAASVVYLPTGNLPARGLVVVDVAPM
jgi:hypothetical protein